VWAWTIAIIAVWVPLCWLLDKFNGAMQGPKGWGGPSGWGSPTSYGRE
jgi:hypothetical protein